MPHALLIPIGSSGDVHPFVGIGIALQSRGHRVTVVTNEYFEPLIRRAGLAFGQLGTKQQYLEVTQNPDLWHPLRGFSTVMESFAEGAREMYDAVVSRLTPDTIVVASSLALSARVAQDKLGFPLVTIHLSPAILRSVRDTPKLPGMPMPPWLPHFMKRGMYALADVAVIDRVAGPPVNKLRAELGLPPAKGIMNTWWHSPQRTLGLWPDWFAAPQPEWPPQLKLTGFPLYDERGAVDVPAAVAAFLDAGSPPIVFTPGSAMRHGRAFFEAAADACVRLNRRGILLTRFAEQLPPALPAGVTHFDFVPFTQVLPRAAALVCHGGVGTISQGFSAGVPLLVMPLSHDQFDNANRVQRLGAGDWIGVKQFKGPAVAAKLDRLLNSHETLKNCRTIAERMKSVDAIGQTCGEIELTLRQTQ